MGPARDWSAVESSTAVAPLGPAGRVGTQTDPLAAVPAQVGEHRAQHVGVGAAPTSPPMPQDGGKRLQPADRDRADPVGRTSGSTNGARRRGRSSGWRRCTGRRRRWRRSTRERAPAGPRVAGQSRAPLLPRRGGDHLDHRRPARRRVGLAPAAGPAARAEVCHRSPAGRRPYAACRSAPGRSAAVPKSEVTVTRAMAKRSSSAWLRALRTAVAERYPAAMTELLHRWPGCGSRAGRRRCRRAGRVPVRARPCCCGSPRRHGVRQAVQVRVGHAVGADLAAVGGQVRDLARGQHRQPDAGRGQPLAAPPRSPAVT